MTTPLFHRQVVATILPLFHRQGMKGGLTLVFVFVLTYPSLSMLGGAAHAWYSFDGFVQFPTKEGGVNEHAHDVQLIVCITTSIGC